MQQTECQMLVFPQCFLAGGENFFKRMKREKNKLKCFFLEFNSMSCFWAVQTWASPWHSGGTGWRCCGCPLGTNPDISYIGTQELGGSFSGGNCHRRSFRDLSPWNATLWDTLWDTSRVLHCGDGFPCVSTSSFSEEIPRKSSLCEIMESRSVFWGMEEEVGPALCKLSWI